MRRPSKTAIRKSKPKKEVIIRELSIVCLTIIIAPFYFAYRLLLQIPASYSPLLGALRAALTFWVICWSTSEAGEALEREASQYLSSFMAISLAEFLVASIGGLCCIWFFIAILIFGGFHLGMEYDGDPRDLNGRAGHEFPNIHSAMKDFDKRLGSGTTIHGFISMFKRINK